MFFDIIFRNTKHMCLNPTTIHMTYTMAIDDIIHFNLVIEATQNLMYISET